MLQRLFLPHFPPPPPPPPKRTQTRKNGERPCFGRGGGAPPSLCPFPLPLRPCPFPPTSSPPTVSPLPTSPRSHRLLSSPSELFTSLHPLVLTLAWYSTFYMLLFLVSFSSCCLFFSPFSLLRRRIDRNALTSSSGLECSAFFFCTSCVLKVFLLLPQSLFPTPPSQRPPLVVFFLVYFVLITPFSEEGLAKITGKPAQRGSVRATPEDWCLLCRTGWITASLPFKVKVVSIYSFT